MIGTLVEAKAQQGMLVIHHGQGEAMELVLLKLLLCTQVRVKFGYPTIIIIIKTLFKEG